MTRRAIGVHWVICCVGIEDIISETNTITVNLLISGMIWCVSILTEIRFSLMRYPEMGALGFRKRLMKMAKKAMSFVIGDIFLSWGISKKRHGALIRHMTQVTLKTFAQVVGTLRMTS